MTHNPYPVVIYAGSNPPTLSDTRVVTINPTSPAPDDVIDSIQRSGLDTSDLRSRAMFVTDLDPARACAVYATVCGFAGRRLDVAAEGRTFRGQALDQFGRSLLDAGRPSEPIRCLQYGAPHPELLSIDGLVVDAPTVSMVRFAKRMRFVPSASTFDTLAALIVIGGIRAKGSLDRLPFLVHGDEPVGDNPTDPVGVCLDNLKRDGAGLKRQQRSDDRSAIAEPETEISDRRRLVIAAAAAPFSAALAVVQARESSTEGVWHCPRPNNHSNGDASASFQVSDDRGHCPRCDVDPIDGLRLVIEVLGVSVDEAAALLLAR